MPKRSRELVPVAPLDYRGTPIVPNAGVAYNLSGTVVLGHVVSVTTWRERVSWGDGWYYTYDIRVMPDADVPGKSTRRESRVTRRDNLVVIVPVA